MKLNLNEIEQELFDEDEPEEVLNPCGTALAELASKGIDISPIQRWWEKGNGLLLAEAVNWAAKVLDERFYELKPRIVEEASRLEDVLSGWENGVFYAFHPQVGTVSFHDPYNEIRADGYWSYGWSGISRQNLAFELISNPRLRLQMRYATWPGELGEWVRSWLWQPRPRHPLP